MRQLICRPGGRETCLPIFILLPAAGLLLLPRASSLPVLFQHSHLASSFTWKQMEQSTQCRCLQRHSTPPHFWAVALAACHVELSRMLPG